MITAKEIKDLEKLEQSLRGLSSVLFSWDMDSKELIFINDAYETLIGTSLDRIYSDPSSFIEHIHPQDKIKTLIGIIDLLENKRKFEGEFRIIDTNGQIKWVHMEFFHEKTEEENHGRLSGQIQDISHWKSRINQLESQLEKNQENLYMLVHDVRGPLQSLQSLYFLLESNLKLKAWDELSANLQLLKNVSADSQNLVNHVLEMIQLEKGLTDLHLSMVNVIALTTALIDQFRPLCLEKSVHLEMITESEELEVMMDEAKFRQVIQNLISNALKFTERNGIIQINLSEEEGYFVLKVSDTGIGISENHLPIIFEKFTKARRKGTKGESTTGLGLAMVKEIVEAHKGEIKVISKENLGTSFLIRIPNRE